VDPELSVVLVAAFGLAAGVAVIWIAIDNRRHIREMEHRERLAMIERGLVPSPERDPATFDRMMGAVQEPPSRGASRARSAGVVMIGLGLAMVFILSFAAGAPEIGVGVGGAFVVVGAAFLVNGMLIRQSERRAPPTYSHYSSVTPPERSPQRLESKDPPSDLTS
jgi:hypothetical protein